MAKGGGTQSPPYWPGDDPAPNWPKTELTQWEGKGGGKDDNGGKDRVEGPRGRRRECYIDTHSLFIHPVAPWPYSPLTYFPRGPNWAVG